MSDSLDPDDLEPNSLTLEEANYLEADPEERMIYVDTGEVAAEDERAVNNAAPGEDVTDAMLQEDVNRADSWLHWNKGVSQVGFSPADQLTTSNVGSLSREWEVELDTEGLQVNPLVVPSDPPVMYVTQGNQVIRALNARTGDQFWEYRYATQRSEDQMSIPGRNRGVAVWQDKVYFATEDGFMLALDRYNGEKQWITDTRWEHPAMDYPQQMVSQSHAPTIHNGVILQGMSTVINWTSIQGIDAETGDIIWRQRTAPKNEWVGDTWLHSSTGSWVSPSVDVESNTAFFPIGDPSTYFNSLVRPGPNKNSVALMAVDVDTGDVKWVHQVMPHENWDYDVSTTPTAVTEMEINGESRRVVAVDWKGAWTYIIDVETGKLVDRSDAWAAQEHQFGRYPFSKFLNRAPWGEENASKMLPAVTGATEYPADSFSPQTGMRYIGANDAAWLIWGNKNWQWSYEEGGDAAAAGGTGFPPAEERDNSAFVSAVDIESGGTLEWQYEFQDVEATAPNPYPGGTSSTAGGLVFAGSYGGNFVALDAESGDRLWVDDTGSRITAAPVTWMDSTADTQMVSIAAGNKIITYTP